MLRLPGFEIVTLTCNQPCRCTLIAVARSDPIPIEPASPFARPLTLRSALRAGHVRPITQWWP